MPDELCSQEIPPVNMQEFAQPRAPRPPAYHARANKAIAPTTRQRVISRFCTIAITCTTQTCNANCVG